MLWKINQENANAKSLFISCGLTSFSLQFQFSPSSVQTRDMERSALTNYLAGLRDFHKQMLRTGAKAKCESVSCFSSALRLSHKGCSKSSKATSCHAI